MAYYLDPYEDDWPPRPKWRASKPKRVEGIEAVSKRGKFGSSWWANQFMAALESTAEPAVLVRGRIYARSRQVLWITVEEGVVTAQVQGSEDQPYQCELRFATIGTRRSDVARWAAAPALSHELLGGRLPPDLEKACQREGFSLVPAEGDLRQAECDCPYWERVCKHMVAVLCLLAERFDREPGEMLRLRGLPADLGDPPTVPWSVDNAGSMWDVRDEAALRTAFGPEADNVLAWLRSAYRRLTTLE